MNDIVLMTVADAGKNLAEKPQTLVNGTVRLAAVRIEAGTVDHLHDNECGPIRRNTGVEKAANVRMFERLQYIAFAFKVLASGQACQIGTDDFGGDFGSGLRIFARVNAAHSSGSQMAKHGIFANHGWGRRRSRGSAFVQRTIQDPVGMIAAGSQQPANRLSQNGVAARQQGGSLRLIENNCGFEQRSLLALKLKVAEIWIAMQITSIDELLTGEPE